MKLIACLLLLINSALAEEGFRQNIYASYHLFTFDSNRMLHMLNTGTWKSLESNLREIPVDTIHAMITNQTLNVSKIVYDGVKDS